jgi:hypothetical protein
LAATDPDWGRAGPKPRSAGCERAKKNPARAIWRGFVFCEVRKAGQGLHDAFALGALASELAGAAHGFGALAGFLLGGLLEMLTGFHFPEQAFALHLLLQRAQSLLDIVIADDDLYYGTSPSGSCGRQAPWNSLISGLTA